MKKYDEFEIPIKSLEALEELVGDMEVFDETIIDFLIHFVRIFEISYEKVWWNAVNAGESSERVLRLATKHPNKWLVRKLAQVFNLHLNVVEQLAQSKTPHVRAEVSVNSTTPAHILEALAWDEDLATRVGVGRNVNTPRKVLKMLAADEDERVRQAVADNPKTPISTLIVMVADKKKGVRANIARNSNTPPRVLKTLTKDEDWWVRARLASNPSTPLGVLERLAKDEDERVASNAIPRLREREWKREVKDMMKNPSSF